MAGFVGPLVAAPTGSTGAQTHISVSLHPAGDQIAVVFIVEAVGATPTVTYKFQGSLDPSIVSDAQANWNDLALLPLAGETVTAAPTAVTAVGASIFYLAQCGVRFLRRVRCVTSLNTNVTYRAEVHQLYGM